MNAAKKVLILGATGTAGRAAARAVAARGHDPLLVLRPGAQRDGLPDAEIAEAEITGYAQTIATHRPDAIVSCIASRTGAPDDARAIDRDANSAALAAAKEAGTAQFILLSAICVQKPKLAFQRAKLEFEAELQASGLDWSIVRPTAFFKSLSGQVERVRAGKPFLVFGDGTLTACKPLSDDDLGAYIADCLTAPEKRNRVLPIGGPGPALTPADQAEILSHLLGRNVPLRRVPVALLDTIITGLSLAGTVSTKAAARADLARIGRYYATESMLVWDEGAGRYDADATPETGTETLRDHYEKLLSGEAETDLGDHAVF